MKRAGVTGSWTTRELRHSAVSILSAGGTPVEEISKRSGHRNTRVTESVYRHNLRPVIRTGVGVIARLIATDGADSEPVAHTAPTEAQAGA